MTFKDKYTDRVVVFKHILCQIDFYEVNQNPL